MQFQSDRFHSYFLLGLLLAALYLAGVVLSPFVHILVIGVVMAILFHPVFSRIERRLGGRSSLAALITVALITLAIILPLLSFATALLGQAADSINALTLWLKTQNLTELLIQNKLYRYIEWLQQYLSFLDFQKIDLQSNLIDLSKESGQFMLAEGRALLGNALGVLINFGVLLFVTFFLMRDGQAMLARLRALTPLRSEQAEQIIARMAGVAKSVVMGSFLIALCQGLAGGLGLWLAGIPALFWGAMMGFASLIPLVGTAVIWAPASLYLLLTGDWQWGLFLLAWGVVVVSGIDTFLRPVIMKGQARISTFFVFLAIIGGVKFFGMIGILYGPLIISFALVMLTLYGQEFSEILKPRDPGCDPRGE
ncbi:MAG: AI-2E family transporter [Desulfovibrionaceae bacterium]|nr:AI-2E family transporter [Desulfovibrionaceae bacterium]MBF0514593.1 AI-2E family transporter [Desulfovibrionaceae bacterium]